MEENLATSIIYPIDKWEWVSHMVMQLKNHDPTKLIICYLLKELIVTDPFLTPFVEEIINDLEGHKCYSSTNDFSITFFIEFGSFTYE